ncbi:MAG TPA: alcohol dehydrogenase catalytic domain-containing protein [Pyrinomonadaceae bacterium]|nr:alcohol dehydrogenase catalytic domain-containing protein [Pyrinomonadaceae bacterium]
MKALRYADGAISLADIPEPENDAEALVRVTLAGVCNTDLEITRGYANFTGTPGHEFVGVVERAPAAGAALVGRRVVGEINAGCGECALCRGGDARHCARRTVLGIVNRDGAFAEKLLLPVANLLLVPDEVSDERAVFTEPLAAACGIAERVPGLPAANKIAVIGDGKLGLLCAQALTIGSGRPVTLIGKHREKLRLVARWGVDTSLLDETHWKREFDVVVEASGAASGFALALDLLRPRGTLVLKSTFHGATEINAAPIVVDEISVVGSRCGRFAPALDLLRAGAIDVESLITDRLPLTDGVRALERAAEKSVLKVLIEP